MKINFDELKQSSLWPPFVLFVIVIIFFWPISTLKSFPYSTDFSSSDLTEINLPFKYVLKQSLSEGEMPWWIDGIASGYPLIAEGQIGFFYPINLIFFGSLPFIAAFNWGMLFHIFWAALGFYLYMRLFKISRAGSLFTALALSLGSIFTFRFRHISLISALAWLPWGLLLAEKYRQKGNFWYAVGAGTALALQILAGNGQMALITYLLLFLYLGLDLFINRKKYQRAGRKAGLIFLFLLISAGVMVGLAAVQIFPTWELVKYSWRQGGLDLAEATISSFHPRNFLNLFYPFVWGNPAKGTYLYSPAEIINKWGIFWEVACYSGGLTALVGVLVVSVALGRRRLREGNKIKCLSAKVYRQRSLVYLWLMAALLGVILALGKYTPVFPWLVQSAPGFAYFRTPSRFIIFLVIAVAVWAGVGVDALMKTLSSQRIRKIAAVLLLSVLMGDLYYVERNYHAYIGAARWLARPAVTAYFSGEKERFRVFTLGEEYVWYNLYQQARGWWYDQANFINNRNSLLPNANLLWGYESSDDLAGLKYKRLWRLVEIAKKEGISPPLSTIDFPKESRIELSPGYQKVLGIQNVKYVLTFFNIINLPQVGRVGFDNLMLPLRIYLNPYFVPRAYLVFSWESFSTDNSLESDKYLIKRMMADDFLPGQMAIVEKQDLPVWQTQAELRGEVEIDKWRSGYIELQAETKKPALLVVSNSYYPGWQARVDSQPVEIVRTNYIYQGIFLLPGRHKVELVYQPTYGRVGMVISLSTLALLFVCAVFWVVVRFKKSP